MVPTCPSSRARASLLAPPLPDGYTVGERVYYTGESTALKCGSWIEFGSLGRVLGATTCECHEDECHKGVDVLFSSGGGRVQVCCSVSIVRHVHSGAAGGWRALLTSKKGLWYYGTDTL